MQRFKTPKKSLFDYLTHENYFLNERYNETMRICNESEKMVEILRKDIDYTNKFIYSTYDLSSNNYSPNLKIVAYDSSDNVITYICTDSSGNFSSTIQLGQGSCYELNPPTKFGEHLQKTPSYDLSINEPISDMSRCFPYYYYDHPYHYHRRYRYRDMDEDRGITSKPTNVIHTTTVNGVVTHTDEQPRCLYPYIGGYPYGGYPYGILDDDDDYDNRNIEINHPYHPPPQYPVVNPPVHPPIIHRDLIDHSLMHKQYELDKIRFSQTPYHRYKNK